MVAGQRLLPSDWLGPEPPDNDRLLGYESDGGDVCYFVLFSVKTNEQTNNV